MQLRALTITDSKSSRKIFYLALFGIRKPKFKIKTEFSCLPVSKSVKKSSKWSKSCLPEFKSVKNSSKIVKMQKAKGERGHLLNCKLNSHNFGTLFDL